jgi:hypothetical protein
MDNSRLRIISGNKIGDQGIKGNSRKEVIKIRKTAKFVCEIL